MPGDPSPGATQGIPKSTRNHKNQQKSTKKLENFSGREISKLGIAWQASAYGSHKGELTEEMMDVVFEIALAQHTQKIDWR